MRRSATHHPARPLARGRSRTLVRIVAPALVAMVLVGGIPSVAGAALKIEATYALGGIVRPGAPAAMSVTITSDRILAADLVVRVSTDQGPLVVSRPVEVPGGSKKRFLVVVPAATVDDVRLVSKNKILGSAVPVRAGESTQEIVGVVVPTESEVLPREHVRLEPVARDADVVAVPQEILDLGPGALGPLTHLVVDASFAAGFSPRQRDAVLAFAANGGELIAAAATEKDLAFLPAAWRGSGGGTVRRSVSGAGVTTVALAAYSSAAWGERGEMWSRTIRPFGKTAITTQPFEGSQWLSALAETGGLSASRVAWLLTFVLAYVAIAGPINFIVLARMRRRELAWVTIPILSVLFAAGAYAAGRGVRSGPVLQAAGIAVYDTGVERTASSFAIMSRGGGIERLTLGGDWIVAPLSSPDFFGPFRASLPKLTPGRDQATAAFDLPVGGVGTALARRTRMRSVTSTGTLTWDGESYTGAVSNPAPFTLRDARVFVGGDRIVAGTLSPGEQTRVKVTPGPAQPFDGQLDFFGFRPDGSPAVSGALISLAGSYAGLGQPGHAFLAGYADVKDAAQALGLPRGAGRVLVLVRLGTVVGASKRIPASAVRRSLLTTDQNNIFEEGPGMLMMQLARGAVFRFELPAGGTGGVLQLNLPDDQGFMRGVVVPGGGFIGKPVPVVPPEAPAAFANDLPVVAPGAVPQVQAPNVPATLSLWDFRAARWVKMTVKDGAVRVAAADRSRFVSEGQLLARITDSPDKTFRIASFTLEEAV